jgi:hypothetical protein
MYAPLLVYVRFFKKEKKEFGDVVHPFRPVQEVGTSTWP